MADAGIPLVVVTGDRAAIRRQVVEEFLEESPGHGTGTLTARYRYDVERLRDGASVYLLRPTWLNKGFDFTIHIGGYRFGGTTSRPTHKNVLMDLETKVEADQKAYGKVRKAIVRVHECSLVSIDAAAYDLENSVGWPNDVLLSVIKWMFIEQDVTYWNYSGRDMLMSKINEIA